MDTGHEINRTVRLVPASLLCFSLLTLDDFTEELNVSRGEEIETTIDIDDALPRLGLMALHFLDKGTVTRLTALPSPDVDQGAVA